MAEMPVAQAAGAILAHSVAAPGIAFKKGRVLSANDVQLVAQAGIATVHAVHLEPGDMPEDEAAAAIAAVLAGPGIDISAAFTGRANLYARAPGLVLIDAARVHRLNAVDESITLATLAPYDAVAARVMLATVKIIPFAAPRDAVEAITSALHSEGPILRLEPFTPKRVVLISTTLSGMKESLLDKNRGVLAQRLGPLQGSIVSEHRVAHTTDAIRGAIEAAQGGEADILMVFGASAIVDRGDVIPEAIVQAGGAALRFGMPVDPGNLLLLATLNGKPVIGLPGCARSPKRNGLDWVLERLCANVAVTGNDIAMMGAGGLLKEIPSRPQPRDPLNVQGSGRPRIAALLLAAGQSRRMGGPNKLLMPFHGRPMIGWAAEALAKSSARPLIAVTGHEAEKVAAAVDGLGFRAAHNADFAQGLSTSLQCGLAALPQDCDGVIVMLGDMPALKAADIDRLIAAFNPAEGRAIIVPVHQGSRGNPVLFARSFFDAMAEAQGDMGARAVIAENEEKVCEVDMPNAAILADADTPEAFDAILSVHVTHD